MEASPFDVPQEVEPSRNDDVVMPLEGHLHELRSRLVRTLVSLAGTCLVALAFSDQILALLTRTAAAQTFIFLSPVEPIMVKLRVSVLSGVVVTAPYALIEAWAFIRPGLMATERRYTLVFVPPILLSFAAGALFAYFVFLPVGVTFFLQMAGPLLEPRLSIAAYSEFALMFMLLFGLLAELPLALVFLGKLGLVTSATLARRRPTLIVGIFFVAALFTPPDGASQLLLALPLLLLFEGGILAMRFLGL